MPLRIPFRAAALAAILSVPGCGPKADPSQTTGQPIGDTLTLTIVPYEAADKLSEEYTPMAQFLAKRLGKKSGKFLPVVDYAGVLAALETGQVDVAYISPLPYALATSKFTLFPLAMPWIKNKLTYHGIIFVRAESPIRKLEDLKGKTFAFGDVTSTTGYLLPMRTIENAGVQLKDFKRYYNAGDSNMVVSAVEHGEADAGAAYENVFEVAYRDHPDKTKKMRIIGQTEDIANGIYVGRGNLPDDDVRKLKQAFLAMNTDPEGHAAMLKAPQEKMVPPQPELFEGIREKAKSLGLDLTSLDKKK